MTNSKLRKRWLYKNADWSRFEETIEQSLGRELDKEHSIDEISNIIINSAKSSIPQTSGAAIPEVKTARILGVWINRKGLFTAHGAKTKEALRNRISFISALAPKVNRSSLWKICNAVCLSKLMYGVELYGTDLANTLQPTFNQLGEVVVKRTGVVK